MEINQRETYGRETKEKGRETRKIDSGLRIKLKRDSEEDEEEEEGSGCCPQAVKVLRVHPASCSHLSWHCPSLLLRPGLSTSHVVHTGKWSLTNLFHYRNDLHD